MSAAEIMAKLSANERQLPMDFRDRIAAKAEEARNPGERTGNNAGTSARLSTTQRANGGSSSTLSKLHPAASLPPETEDLCATCGKTAQRYTAFRDGKVWRLVCKGCHDAAWQPLGPVPCSGCNAPSKVVTMLGGRVVCAACRVRP